MGGHNHIPLLFTHSNNIFGLTSNCVKGNISIHEIYSDILFSQEISPAGLDLAEVCTTFYLLNAASYVFKVFSHEYI